MTPFLYQTGAWWECEGAVIRTAYTKCRLQHVVDMDHGCWCCSCGSLVVRSRQILSVNIVFRPSATKSGRPYGVIYVSSLWSFWGDPPHPRLSTPHPPDPAPFLTPVSVTAIRLLREAWWYHVMYGRRRSAFTLTKRTCWIMRGLATFQVLRIPRFTVPLKKVIFLRTGWQNFQDLELIVISIDLEKMLATPVFSSLDYLVLSGCWGKGGVQKAGGVNKTGQPHRMKTTLLTSIQRYCLYSWCSCAFCLCLCTSSTTI